VHTPLVNIAAFTHSISPAQGGPLHGQTEAEGFRGDLRMALCGRGLDDRNRCGGEDFPQDRRQAILAYKYDDSVLRSLGCLDRDVSNYRREVLRPFPTKLFKIIEELLEYGLVLDLGPQEASQG
jgi:hypothetical protein